jgi:hypothetical protein
MKQGQLKLAIENVGLAYSPMAFGSYREILTGEKHLKQGLTCFLNIQGYNSTQCTEATKLYQDCAKKWFKLTELSWHLSNNNLL